MAPIIDTTVIGSVLTWVEGHPALVEANDEHLPVAQEDLATGATGVMVATMPGDPYVRRYKDGGYLASYPFGVYLRVKAVDTAARIDAVAALSDMGASIDEKAMWPAEPTGYEFTGLVLTTTPARIAENDDGTADYQVTFELTYRKKG